MGHIPLDLARRASAAVSKRPANFRRSAMLDFSDYIQKRTQHFSGREWVFTAINDWLAKPGPPGTFLLTGGPGTGKSAIAARVVQMSKGNIDASPYPELLTHNL